MSELIGNVQKVKTVNGTINYPGAGDSAYQVAVNNGFVGSETEWLNSLKGENGSTPIKGVDYFTSEDKTTMKNEIETDIQPILENIEDAAKQAEVIAKGRATGYVFDTLEDLENWLSIEENTSKLVLGDNLYIRTVGVPDYWWDGTSKQVLETEKPDLTEYAKQEQFVTLTQAEYDALTEKSANTYYFIIEEE